MAKLVYVISLLILVSISIRNPPKRVRLPIPFHDFTLFAVLSLFTYGSPNAGGKYSACVGETGREKREGNK